MSSDRIAHLRRLMYGLECSDDLLHSDGNGNLALWEAWRAELSELERDAVDGSK